MALTSSNEFLIGASAPDFNLMNTVSGKKEGLSQLKGTKGTAIFFICNHCPFVIHVNELLVQLAKEYQSKGIGFIAISSNDIEAYPQDGPEMMKAHAEKYGYPFPYLYDETQQVAKAYAAACTPDVYVFDADLKAIYHGQLCDSRPGNGIPVTGADFKNALDCLLEGKPQSTTQKPSIGCGIKWK